MGDVAHHHVRHQGALVHRKRTPKRRGGAMWCSFTSGAVSRVTLARSSKRSRPRREAVALRLGQEAPRRGRRPGGSGGSRGRGAAPEVPLFDALLEVVPPAGVVRGEAGEGDEAVAVGAQGVVQLGVALVRAAVEDGVGVGDDGPLDPRPVEHPQEALGGGRPEGAEGPVADGAVGVQDHGAWPRGALQAPGRGGRGGGSGWRPRWRAGLPRGSPPPTACPRPRTWRRSVPKRRRRGPAVAWASTRPASTLR